MHISLFPDHVAPLVASTRAGKNQPAAGWDPPKSLQCSPRPTTEYVNSCRVSLKIRDGGKEEEPRLCSKRVSEKRRRYDMQRGKSSWTAAYIIWKKLSFSSFLLHPVSCLAAADFSLIIFSSDKLKMMSQTVFSSMCYAELQQRTACFSHNSYKFPKLYPPKGLFLILCFPCHEITTAADYIAVG